MSTRLQTLLPLTAALALTLTVIADTFSVFMPAGMVITDVSTYLLPAVARENGAGDLYVGLLDIKPPLTFALFVPWVAMFGSSFFGIWIFYSILLLAMFTGFYLALVQELRPWLATIVFSFTVITILTFGMLDEFLFTTEVIGSTAILWGVVAARRKPEDLRWLFFAAFLLTIAGQVKDVFLLVPLALAPLIWNHPERLRAFMAAAAGCTTTLVMTVLILLWWGPGSLASYIEVLRIKRERFPLPGGNELLERFTTHADQVIQWLPLLALFGLAVAITLFVSSSRTLQSHALQGESLHITPSEWMLIAYLPALYVGFLWQGSDLLKTYALAVIFPVYLLFAVVIRIMMTKLDTQQQASKVVLIGLLIIGISPSGYSILSAVGRALALPTTPVADLIGGAESDEVLAQFRLIRDLADDGDCLHVAYDWTATIAYLYSEVPPCTRIVVPPLAAQMPSLGAELKDTLPKRPPSIMIIDWTRSAVESASVPYRAIVDQCYESVLGNSSIYRLRDDLPSAEDCIESTYPDPQRS